MDMDSIIFGEITIRQILYALGSIAAITIVLKILKKLFFPPKSNLQHSAAFTCAGCGWTGHIGQYAHSCPKCSRPVDSNI